jgi:SAM-dependent methyltransferase
MIQPIIVTIFLILCTMPVYGQYNNIYVESAWEKRDKWQHPEWIIEAMQAVSGKHVADIGCHEGYMTVKLAKAVGSRGKVFAVDIDGYKLDKLRIYLKEKGYSNVQLITADNDNPKTPGNTLDAILILDTYHEIDDYETVLNHLKKSLKSDGRLVIIEPVADERKDWSRKKQTDKHEIAIRYVKEELKEAGFIIIDQKDMFLDRTKEKGDKLWLLVAMKPLK